MAFAGFDPIAVANEIILQSRDDEHLSNLKLQKLLYVAHAVHLTCSEGEPLLRSDSAGSSSKPAVEAWPYGPVVPLVYEKSKGARSFAGPLSDSRLEDSPEADELHIRFAKQTIAVICDLYKDASAANMVALTHEDGSAWSSVTSRGSEIRRQAIPNELIQAEYEARLQTGLDPRTPEFSSDAIGS